MAKKTRATVVEKMGDGIFIRLPADMENRIRRAADADRRTLSAYIRLLIERGEKKSSQHA